MKTNDNVWRVVRVKDGLLLGRYISKPKALAAALDLSKDGGHYDVVQETGAGSKPDPMGVLLPLRGN